jgi:hypothetical protein
VPFARVRGRLSCPSKQWVMPLTRFKLGAGSKSLRYKVGLPFNKSRARIATTGVGVCLRSDLREFGARPKALSELGFVLHSLGQGKIGLLGVAHGFHQVQKAWAMCISASFCVHSCLSSLSTTYGPGCTCFFINWKPGILSIGNRESFNCQIALQGHWQFVLRYWFARFT